MFRSEFGPIEIPLPFSPEPNNNKMMTSPPVTGSYTITVGAAGGEVEQAGGSDSYRNTVERIRQSVSGKFDATKRTLMERLESERLRERELNNAQMARRYSNIM